MVFRTTIPFLIGGAILLGGAFVTLSRRAEKKFDHGVELEQEGRISDAIEQYEWAIQAYTPFGDYPSKALENLRRIAFEAELSGATETAIDAWQSIVSGLLVIENLTQPFADSLSEAEQHLQALRKTEALLNREEE